MSSPLLGAAQLRALLDELAERLDARGLSGRLFVVGGAAMALAFNRERVTRDIDAVFEPKAVIYDEAARMAADRGLPPDWLNDGVKGLLPTRAQPTVGTRYARPGLSVEIASADYLFAMKAAAGRIEADGHDLRVLADHLGIVTLADALDLVERFYDPARLTPKTVHVIDDALAGVYDAPVAASDSPDPGTRVKPYGRADGTVVRGHRRRAR